MTTPLFTEGLDSDFRFPDYSDGHSSFRFYSDVVRGLLGHPKTLPCKYFYDEAGSRLFEQICELDEYYLTRTERAILLDHLEEICALCGPECLLVELGSGSSAKTRLLLDHLDGLAGYVPIDIARAELESTSCQLQREYPDLEVMPVCADYHAPFELPRPSKFPRRTVVFFPGSTIGNFEPAAAGRFLREIALMLAPGDGLLVGVDLEKSPEVLEPAYNDAQGVTAEFNLNLLKRINRELGADFHLHSFRHRAIYNSDCCRIEMHLVSAGSQAVHLNGCEVPFVSGAFIVTEHCYKYSVLSFSRLATRAGFQVMRVWTDPKQWFGVWYLEKVQ